ncbi:MAG: histidinol-phosphate transaminase [Actinomycetia bacterium]|nr:histidinol-phosphate transaminase [Actinomycetes bacterium]
MARPQVREDVALMAGYHSPQLDVAVRLNTNEAPEAPPAGFTAELATALGDLDWNRYPDRAALDLRADIARLESAAAGGNLDAARVFAANGSNEVLQSICLAYGGAGRTAVTFEPTYALHSHIARVCGTDVVSGERSNDFTLDMAEVERVVTTESPSITFLCSPNNPTGGVDAPEEIAAVLEMVESVDGLLVVDEAYGQFAPHSALSMVAEGRSLAVTRTFSKTWSAAALRLGYLVGPTWLIEELEKVVLPYHLDAAKQVAGRLALQFGDEMAARVAHLVEERGRVAEALDAMAVTQWPSGANYILIRPDEVAGEDVWQRLVDRGVLVRNCSSWPRLADCLRVTIGTPVENDAFLEALSSSLG